MRLATWNVNSIRSRIDRVAAWLQRSDVDVLAIQETKAKEDQFPHDRFTELGYEVAHHGLNQWNGVAIVSRVGLEDVQIGFDGDPGWGDPVAPEARSIGATCGGVRVWSLYIPNGRALEDPHMDYKLTWLEQLRGRANEWAADGTPLALCGDWNVAPQDEDVWSVEYYEDKTHISAPERAAFNAFLEDGFTDVVRPHAPGPGTYTYWDYQRLAFPKKRGMRIDFVLGSAPFAERVTGAEIDREERKGKGASDHAPVIVDLDGDAPMSEDPPARASKGGAA
ncbi:exodeoxyribonuclease III [Janibacter corallicola]|uniref:exodeoxyribonuclease III n=1 Tax=Janibacter corallicola TaxID=415212 RepID=UPI00083487AD|nr:exodeoxyribonuclease III [Janibacter corallicola]